MIQIDIEMPKNCKECLLNADSYHEGGRCAVLWQALGNMSGTDKILLLDKWGLDKATKYGNETAEQRHFSYSTMMMYEIVDILDDADVIIEADEEAESEN